MSSRIFIVILIIQMLLIGCAGKKSENDLIKNCIKETQSCSKDGCVSLRYSGESENSCTSFKYDCARVQAAEKLNSAGISVGYPYRYNTIIKKYPSCVNSSPEILKSMAIKSCIGYRSDIGGSEEGAKCIASVLGINYQSSGCNADGFAYTVNLE